MWLCWRFQSRINMQRVYWMYTFERRIGEVEFIIRSDGRKYILMILDNFIKIRFHQYIRLCM